MFTLEDAERAHRLVGGVVPPSAARQWPLLSELLGTQTVVKHENHNPTGAFKVRGGLTYLDALTRRKSDVSGIISATRGNHGQSLALAGMHFGVPVTIVVPEGNSVEKNAAMRAYGAELIEHGADFEAAASHALELAGARGLERVPSFHRNLVLGVSTYGLELLNQHSDLDTLYVPIGLGSGICGCIQARDLLGLKTEIVGVQAAGAPSYALSFEAGHAVETPAAQTFADGVATRVPDPEALDMILKGATRVVIVDEQEIADAVRHYWQKTHNLAEGAGAVPLAAALKEKSLNMGRKVGLILSGGNIDLDLFAERIIVGAHKAGSGERAA